MTQIYNAAPLVPGDDQDHHRVLRWQLSTVATSCRRRGEGDNVQALHDAMNILAKTPETGEPQA